MATAAEKKYMGIVAQLPCACCGREGPSFVHHLREDQGMAQRASNFLIIPLCWDCHQGPLGIHGNKTLMRIYKISELSMLATTIMMVMDL